MTVKPEFIQKLFNDVHKDYVNYYKDFSKMMKRVFKEDLSDSEADDIVDWAIQYKNNLENAKSVQLHIAVDDIERITKTFTPLAHL